MKRLTLRKSCLCESVSCVCMCVYSDPFTDKPNHPWQYATRSCQIWVTLSSTTPPPGRRWGREGGRQKLTILLFQRSHSFLFVCVHDVHAAAGCMHVCVCVCVRVRLYVCRVFVLAVHHAQLINPLLGGRGWCLFADGRDLEGQIWWLAP